MYAKLLLEAELLREAPAHDAARRAYLAMGGAMTADRERRHAVAGERISRHGACLRAGLGRRRRARMVAGRPPGRRHLLLAACPDRYRAERRLRASARRRTGSKRQIPADHATVRV